MVWRKHEHTDTNSILQKQFTAYVFSAVKRKRSDYIDKLNNHQRFLCVSGENIVDQDFCIEDEALKGFPLHLQLQNEDLFLSIAELTERERYVFFNRALGELSIEEMAAELGLSYKGVATIYYRTIQKLKQHMNGGTK